LSKKILSDEILTINCKLCPLFSEFCVTVAVWTALWKRQEHLHSVFGCVVSLSLVCGGASVAVTCFHDEPGSNLDQIISNPGWRFS
jgi:hypothetical protein